MEGATVNAYRRLKGYWRRRGYERLAGSSRRNMAVVEMGSTGRRRRRFSWRVKVKPRVKLLTLLRSPRKFFRWLGDAYVKMMLAFASSRVCSAGYGYGSSVAEAGIGAFGKAPMKEYDQKVIVEIYKSLVAAQGQLVAREAGDLRSAIVSRQQ